tara:strand:- start:26 stop:355 length:330 start_codon:yes stop_codon:yes gene_type:complete
MNTKRKYRRRSSTKRNNNVQRRTNKKRRINKRSNRRQKRTNRKASKVKLYGGAEEDREIREMEEQQVQKRNELKRKLKHKIEVLPTEINHESNKDLLKEYINKFKELTI